MPFDPVSLVIEKLASFLFDATEWEVLREADIVALGPGR